MVEILSVGTTFILLGLGLRFLNKSEHYKWAVETRQAMIVEAKGIGDDSRVTKLENEIYVIQKKLPIYGNFLFGTGVTLLIVCLFIKGFTS